MRRTLGIIILACLIGASPSLTRDQIGKAEIAANVREVTALKAFIDSHPAVKPYTYVCRQDAKAAYFTAFKTDGWVYKDLERAESAAELRDLSDDRADYMIGWQRRCLADAVQKESDL